MGDWPLTPALDMWSLAVTMWVMFTGTGLPFRPFPRGPEKIGRINFGRSQLEEFVRILGPIPPHIVERADRAWRRAFVLMPNTPEWAAAPRDATGRLLAGSYDPETNFIASPVRHFFSLAKALQAQQQGAHYDYHDLKCWNRQLGQTRAHDMENFRQTPVVQAGKLVSLAAAISDLLAEPAKDPGRRRVHPQWNTRTGRKLLCIPKGVWFRIDTMQHREGLKKFFSIGENRCATGTPQNKRLAAKRGYDPFAFTGVHLDLSGAGADDDVPDQHPGAGGATTALAATAVVEGPDNGSDAVTPAATPVDENYETIDYEALLLVPGQEDGAMETPDHVEEFESEEESEDDKEEVGV